MNTIPSGDNLGNVGGVFSLPVFSDFVIENGSVLAISTISEPGIYIATAENLCGISSDTLHVKTGGQVLEPIISPMPLAPMEMAVMIVLGYQKCY